jgi:AcrR family transcriptional regulator
MARIKSDEKRNAILAAATEIFADRGLGASTLSISNAAGVAEGTLFTYFKTKDELVNALYREIKLELADAMMSGFPRKASVLHRLRHVWNGYVEWGVSHPLQQRVLKQIELRSELTEESKSAGAAPFLEIQKMVADAIEQRLLRDLPQEFLGATLNAMAQTTMEFIERDQARAELYRVSGFEMLWAAIKK